MIRLDKALSHIGLGSRKEVKNYIRKGYIVVNGEVVYDDDFKINPDEDEIIIDGEQKENPPKNWIEWLCQTECL